MPTKTDLEKQIATMEGHMREKQRALNLLAEDTGCVVKIPEVDHAFTANYGISADRVGSRKDTWRVEVMQVIGKVVREHGVCLKEAHADGRFWHTHNATEINLVSDGMHGYGVPYLVPKLVGEFIVAFVNGAAVFGHQCYARGYEDGADLLVRVSRGEISVDQFDDSIEEQKARAMQSSKDYRRLKVRKIERTEPEKPKRGARS